MKKLEVYLVFNGNCEEALNFYAGALGGPVEFKQTYGESDIPSQEDDKQKIMHSRFRAGDIFFMASDTMPGNPINSGNQISLSIDTDSVNAQSEMFAKLSEGGAVTMELQDTFWGARFGMLTDKFGIIWMINCEKKSE